MYLNAYCNNYKTIIIVDVILSQEKFDSKRKVLIYKINCLDVHYIKEYVALEIIVYI